MVVEGGLSTRYFTGGQLNALGNQERFSEMQWAFKKATNPNPAAAAAAAAGGAGKAAGKGAAAPARRAGAGGQG